MIDSGFSGLWDVGRRLGWAEFRSWVNGRRPDQSSALWRARHPKSYWRTPEIDFLAGLLFASQVGNWQRGGGKGRKPEPVKLPEDRPAKVKSPTELKAKRRSQREHLARRRAQQRSVQKRSAVPTVEEMRKTLHPFSE